MTDPSISAKSKPPWYAARGHQHGNGEIQSLEQIQGLVEASEEIRFQCQDRVELYEWVNRTLRQQDYGRLRRGGKALVRRYIAKMTGLSRAQTARLIRYYQAAGEVNPLA